MNVVDGLTWCSTVVLRYAQTLPQATPVPAALATNWLEIDMGVMVS